MNKKGVIGVRRRVLYIEPVVSELVDSWKGYLPPSHEEIEAWKLSDLF